MHLCLHLLAKLFKPFIVNGQAPQNNSFYLSLFTLNALILKESFIKMRRLAASQRFVIVQKEKWRVKKLTTPPFINTLGVQVSVY